MWCICVCVCALAEKGEGCCTGRGHRRDHAERQGEAEGTAPSTTAAAQDARRGGDSTAHRGTHTCVSQGTPGRPVEERAWHVELHTQHAGGTRSAQDGRARNRRPPAPRAAPQRARPPARDGAPWPPTRRQTPSCVHGSQRRPEGGAHAPAPTRAPRPVLRPAPPGPPGSPAQGGPDPHTVTTAGGLSDEEERGAAYAWL